MAVRKILSRLIDIIFPHSCMGCKQLIESSDRLCHNCWGELDFISGEIAEKINGDIKNNRYIKKIISVSNYNQLAKDLIMKFKYQRKIALSKVMAYYMGVAIAKQVNIDAIDVISNIPLHLHRLLKRGFNQSYFLARDIATNQADITLIPDLLLRKKSAIQKGLGKRARYNNMKNAFQFNDKYIIKGKNILLIDDVIASKATAFHCAKILKENGAGNIYIASFAITGYEKEKVSIDKDYNDLF